MIPNENPALAQSLWWATSHPSEPLPVLEEHLHSEVAIIGAGFAGLSAALHLSERGVSTVVLDAQSVGWGASGRNGGQVLPGLKEDPDTIERMYGAERGGQMVRLSGGAPDEVFALIERHAIACDPVRAGWIQPAHSAATLAASAERVRQWQRRGASIEPLTREAIAELLGTRAYLGGAIDRRAGSVHPLNYSLGLAAACTRLGARIRCGSAVQRIDREPSGGYRLTTEGGSVRSAKVLVCTNGYTPPAAGALRRSVIPVCSVQVASRPVDPERRSRVLAKGQVVSDMYRLLNYYRFDAHGRFVMGGRGAYRTAGILRQIERLRRRASELFADSLGTLHWEFAWGGNVAITKDHFPHLNRLDEGIYAAVGFNGRGVAMATVLGRLLADLAGGARDDEIDFPVSAVRPVPFHALHPFAVGSAIAWNGFLDRASRRPQ